MFFFRDDGKLFEWVDGPLVTAVLTGAWFLADEISLADDSVLERLNSLLGKFILFSFAENLFSFSQSRNGRCCWLKKEAR